MRPSRLRLPRYRVWAGFALWIGATIADALLIAFGPAWWARGPAGALSLAGFILAFAWSQHSGRTRG